MACAHTPLHTLVAPTVLNDLLYAFMGLDAKYVRARLVPNARAPSEPPSPSSPPGPGARVGAGAGPGCTASGPALSFSVAGGLPPCQQELVERVLPIWWVAGRMCVCDCVCVCVCVGDGGWGETGLEVHVCVCVWEGGHIITRNISAVLPSRTSPHMMAPSLALKTDGSTQPLQRVRGGPAALH